MRSLARLIALLAVTSTAAAFDLGSRQPAKSIGSSIYTPPAADITVGIDLCYSSFDTKLYIDDQNMDLVACNADAIGVQQRDTDWFRVPMNASGLLEITGDAESPTRKTAAAWSCSRA